MAGVLSHERGVGCRDGEISRACDAATSATAATAALPAPTTRSSTAHSDPPHAAAQQQEHGEERRRPGAQPVSSSVPGVTHALRSGEAAGPRQHQRHEEVGDDHHRGHAPARRRHRPVGTAVNRLGMAQA